MAKIAKMRVYVGPLRVEWTADKLAEAGFEVVCEGTEHVHFKGELGEWGLLDVSEEVSAALGYHVPCSRVEMIAEAA